MKYLLDTHVLLWWRYDTTKLSQKVKDIIESYESEVFISYASIWELEIKYGLGKLALLGIDTVQTLVQDEVVRNDFFLLPIKRKHLFTLSTLENHHKDPFDRMLVAQTRIENMTLITYDTNIQKYNIPILY